MAVAEWMILILFAFAYLWFGRLWAKYGFWQALNYGSGKLLLVFTVLILITAGALNKNMGLEFPFMKGIRSATESCFILALLAFAWMLINRNFLLPGGTFQHHQAMSRTWVLMRKYLSPKQINEAGYRLKNSDLFRETRELFTQAINEQNAGDRGYNCQRLATAHKDRGLLSRIANDFEGAENDFNEALGCLDQGFSQNRNLAGGVKAGLLDLKAHILFRKGEAAHAQGKKTEAKDLYEQAQNIYRKLGDTWQANSIERNYLNEAS